MPSKQPEVLVVSKPLVPPWDDGGKTLVRELVAHARRFRFRVPITAGAAVPWEQAEPWPVYGRDTGYSPGVASKLKMFFKLLFVRASDIRHFFFAPNFSSSVASRLASWARPGPVVQTICSAPKDYSDVTGLLFGDKVVVLSEHTRRNLIDAGVTESRLQLIPPGVTVPEPATRECIREARERFGLRDGLAVLYAGDYDYSRAARTVLEAALRVCSRRPDVRFVFACRLKNQNCSDEEQRLKALVARANLGNRIHFKNYIEDFPELLTAVDLCVLPAESVYAKVDLPLTLLEAMARRTPLVVADVGPLPELLQGKAGTMTGEAGETVRPADPEQLAEAIERIFSDPARLNAMSEAARAVVQNRFSAELMSSRHEELYSWLSEEPS